MARREQCGSDSNVQPDHAVLPFTDVALPLLALVTLHRELPAEAGVLDIAVVDEHDFSLPAATWVGRE